MPQDIKYALVVEAVFAAYYITNPFYWTDPILANGKELRRHLNEEQKKHLISLMM